MKLKILAMLLLMALFTSLSEAAIAVSTPAPIASVKAEKAVKKMEKKQAKMTKRLEKQQKRKGFFAAVKERVKSQVAALLLCLFVGLIGIHRFYLGYPIAGIVQIITFGGFGIWTLVDFILIITGDLKPKDGYYDPSF